MVLTKKGRLFRRQDGKYLIYVPLDVATDSQFPFPEVSQRGDVAISMAVLVTIDTKENRLIISRVGG